MDPDLGDLCASLSIRDDEESSGVAPKSLLSKNPNDGGAYLVGRVLSKKTPKLESLTSALHFAFKASHGLEIRKLGDNRFLFRFNDEMEANYVLLNGPWHYDKFTLVLALVSDGDNPYAVDLSWCEFNIKLHNLPVLSIRRESAEYLGNEVGKFKEAVIPGNGFCADNMLKMKVSINTNSSLKRMIRLKLEDGSSAIIPITYERLQNFCFNCGKLDHLQKDCNEVIPEGPPPFGPWLRESPRLRANRSPKDDQAEAGKESHDTKSSPSPHSKRGLGNVGENSSPESVANGRQPRNTGKGPRERKSNSGPEGSPSLPQDVEMSPPDPHPIQVRGTLHEVPMETQPLMRSALYDFKMELGSPSTVKGQRSPGTCKKRRRLFSEVADMELSGLLERNQEAAGSPLLITYVSKMAEAAQQPRREQ
ncbi:hypothetical protein M569_16260 [Genlisea aurea]|uniref:CCHC-type domain-containing protein n=1 Tax=Genlisea aurea TaxID=192259 RepID=S8DGP6_9LAMI|nr:hypothetical protein M569_16260 [Genlisea aurea]